MSYRDDLDAAHGRVEALEQELAETKAALNKSTALVKVSEAALMRRQQADRTATRFLGAPLRLEHERTVDGDLPESAYIKIADFLSRHFDIGGRTSTMPGRLEWVTDASAKSTGPFVSVTVTSIDGQTTVRVLDRVGQLAGAIYGGVGGGVGVGGFMAPGALFFVNPILGAIALPLWFGGIYWGCRALFKSRVNKHQRQLTEALEGVVEIVTSEIEKAAGSAS